MLFLELSMLIMKSLAIILQMPIYQSDIKTALHQLKNGIFRFCIYISTDNQVFLLITPFIFQ